jgi:excisionase family DNA binding protein
MATSDTPTFFTISEAAAVLRVHPRTIRNRVKQGFLSARRIQGSHKLLIGYADLMALVQDAGADPRPSHSGNVVDQLRALKSHPPPQSLAEIPRTAPPAGMTVGESIRGRWPGDESEADLLALLRTMM